MKLLEVDGEISNPRTFTFDELSAVPHQLAEPSLLLGGRAIRGVRLSALLRHLGIKPWARFAIVHAGDGYAATIPVEAIGDCVLVYAIGDASLPALHGGPVRLIARGLERCANVKNVTTLSFAVEPLPRARACPHELARSRRSAFVSSDGES